MGNRSYVIAEKSGEATILLEANNLLPLLWVAALETDQLVGLVSLPSDSPGIEDKGPVGFSMTPDQATAQLMRRRALIERWFGTAGGIIVDQFAELLNSKQPQRIHIDLTEYIELDRSADSFLGMLQQAAAALDTDPSKGSLKRRPSAIKWLMDEFNLSGVADSTPLYGLAMAGSMENDSEPWRREAPRPRRTPGEKMYPANGDHHVSQDGRVIVGPMRNGDELRTPLVWNRVLGTSHLLNVPDNVGDVYVYHLSHDGSVLVGGCTTYPAKRESVFRYEAGQMTLLATDPQRLFLIRDASADASVLLGNHYSLDRDYESYSLSMRAFRIEGDNTPVDIGPPGAISAVSVVTPDGRYAGGYTEHGPLETREQRAFVWSEQEKCVDLGPGFFMLDWVAIAPDGQSGLLEYMTERGGPTGYQFWRRGRAFQAIPELLEARMVRVSAAADAIVASVEGYETPVLWTYEGGLRPLDLGPVTGTTEALYVADGARAVVVVESPPGASWGCKNMLIWKDDKVERHRLYGDADGDVLGWRYENRPPAVADFVTAGKLLNKGDQLSWGPGSGLMQRPDAGDVHNTGQGGAGTADLRP